MIIIGAVSLNVSVVIYLRWVIRNELVLPQVLSLFFPLEFFHVMFILESCFYSYYYYFKASLVAQVVKHLPAMWETQVQFLGREDPLEKGMATHSNILAWRIPWTEEPGGLQSRVLQKVGRDCLLVLSLFFAFLEDILLYVTVSLSLPSFFSSSFLTSFLSSFFLPLSRFSFSVFIFRNLPILSSLII